MRHLILFFFAFSIISSLITLYLSVLFYIRHKKSIIIQFGLFTISLILFMFPIAIKFYLNLLNINVSPSLSRILTTFSSGANILYFITLPIFAHSILTISISKIKKVVFTSILAIICLAVVLYHLRIAIKSTLFILNYGMQAMSVYVITICLIHFDKIGSKFLRKSIIIFIVFSAFFIPLFLLDIAYFEYAYALPLYMSILNLMFIKFSLVFFQQPSYIKDEKITKAFKETYRITEREGEIINMILTGLSHKETSKKLFISVKTVGNHIQNIYKKLGINNKLQLLNLIQNSK